MGCAPEEAMKFSLILATIHRTSEPKRFLHALAQQTHRDFELVVVDQNKDDNLQQILAPYQGRFPIQHLHAKPGLSRARNKGLQHITGDIVAFPDDDCWFSPHLLEQVSVHLSQHPDWNGLTGCSINEQGELTTGRWDTQSGFLNRFNVWRRGVSSSIFLHRKVVEKVGSFDPALGIGAGTIWGSGEESDYLLRALGSGFQLYYEPSIQVHHLEPVQGYDAQTIERAARYAPGVGYVLRKHNYPLWFVMYQCLRPFGGAVVSLLRGKLTKAKYHWTVFRGRASGWLS
jgi:glycosyltransferase involved in cell wall biosynthesis